MRIVLTFNLLIWFTGTCLAQQGPAPERALPPPDPATDLASAGGDRQGKAASPAQPPATPPDTDQNGAERQPAQPRIKLPPLSVFSVDLGYGDWGLSGSRSEFRQYATIPTGFFVRDLRYAPLLRTPGSYAFFDAKGLVEDDYRAETRLGWGFGATRAEGYLSLFQFQDPLPNPVDPSTRIVSGFAVKQILSPGFGLTFRYQDDRQQNNYAVPYSNLDQHTRFWNVAATGKWGPGFATLNYSNLYYSDHTGVLPNMMAQNAGLSYLWNVSNAVSLEASYSHLLISQHDAQQSKIDTLALTGDFALGSATDLDIHLQQRNLSLPTVQSAFTRAQSLGTASLSQRWKSWRAQVGVRLQDDDRVNGDQTYVDVPKWSTVEGRISGRLMPDWRLTVKGYTQALFNPPPAITMDPRSLYFNGRNYLQVRLEGGPPDINYYLVYTHQDNRNSARSTEVQTDQYTAGSIWQLSPTLSLFGEYHHEVWSGHTDLDVFPTLSDFLPDSTTGIVELTWNLPHLYLSASYTGFAENNANPLLLQDGNAHGSYLTLSGHYRFPRGYQLGLSISPWAYHDNTTSALDYNAAIIMVTGSARF